MATRIYAIPDKNGVIRVACGGDELEIVVAAPSRAPRKPGKSSSGSGISPFDRPHAMHVGPVGPTGGRIDVDAIMRRFRAQKKAPHLPDPDGLVIRGRGAIDLHEVTRLSSRLRRSGASHTLGVKFDDDE